MISKIIDILEDNFDNYDEIAMQEKFIKIATEIDKIVYLREFVRWFLTRPETNDGYPIFIGKSGFYNPYKGKWTLDELHEYWKTNIKEK
jgi:hypothetical protein